ncbi:MAG: hypothetical protein ACRDTH_18700 [Pseudonocardiaceae bacterium]
MPVVCAASAVVSPPPQRYHEDPSILAFYRDLVEPFGAEVDEQLLHAGTNVSHRELVDTLVKAEDVRGCQADLIIVTHGLPDLHPFTAVASHLNMLFGGGAQSFSISEQGLAAPFTALRIVASFQRSGRANQAVVAVLEQTTLPTRHALVQDPPLVDSGALLVFGRGAGLRVDEVGTVGSQEAISTRVREFEAGDPSGTLLVIGPWVDWDGVDAGSRVHRVEPGSYCTSVWLELARHWRRWQQDYTTVVLCDVDPRTHRGHFAVLRTSPAE